MAEDQDRVVLTVEGRRFEGWTSVSVSKGIADLAGTFSLEYASRTSDAGELQQIRGGQACTVSIGGQVVITGWVDATAPSFNPDRRTLRIEGRDRAGDLVDCSALNQPGVWRGRTLLQIASDLVAPFGLAVSALADVGVPFRSFALQQGETVWDALGRLAKFRGLLAISDADGDIVFITPARSRAGFSLRQGYELIGASATDDGRDRFSRYLVKGQSAGDDDTNGVSAAGPKGEAADPGVARYRPLLIVSEEQATLASLRDRAAWEASVRAAQGRSAQLTVQGWRDPAGALWRADLIVPVVAPWIDIEADLLIADVTYSLTLDGGSTTVLTCAPPDAYRPEPPSGEARP